MHNKQLKLSFFLSLAFAILGFNANSQSFEKADLEELRGQLEKVDIDEDGDEIDKEEPFIVPKERFLESESEASIKNFELDIERPKSFDQKPFNRSLALKIKPFGYDFFSKASSTFAPATDIPIPSDYILGPGDNIKLFLFGNINEEYSLQISREGQVFLPQVGVIFLAGMTFAEAKNVINDRVSSQLIGTNAVFTLGELRSIRVFILGDAYQPGSYIVSGLSRLSNALFISGGVSLSGSLRNIEHKRGGKTITSFDLYDLLLKGDTTNDSRLQDGDVIYIPPIQRRVSITGEVNRPGMYEIKANENIEDLIKYSGGLKPTADLKRANIDTIKDGRLSLESINLGDKKSITKQPKNGDILHVFPVINNYDDAILLSNYIRNQGFVAWKEGIRMADLIDPSYDLLSNTDRRYVLIKRTNKETGRLSFIQANIENIDDKNKNDQASNPKLMKNDELFFFQKLEDDDAEALDDPEMDKDLMAGLIEEDQILDEENEAEFRPRSEIIDGIVEEIESQSSPTEPNKIVNIFGLRYPGSYPHTKNMKLKEVIDAGGGFLSDVVLSEIEIIEISNADRKEVFNKKTISTLNERNLNLSVNPGSFVVFKTSFNEKRVAQIAGEVRFPGSYIIQEDETLSDLIIRAGGLKSSASPEAAFFSRESLKENEKKRIEEARKLLQQEVLLSQVSDEIGAKSVVGLDAGLLSEEIDENSLGRLVINLEEIISTGIGDITLQDGDSITIPRFSNVVSVIGEVSIPSTHLYDSRMSITDYVAMSGDITQLGDESSIYVIAANGSVKQNISSGFFRGASELNPGDTIVVPLKIDTFSNIQAITEVTQIVYQLAVGAAAVSSF